MNDIKAQTISQLAKLIDKVAKDEMLVVSLAVESHPRFATFSVIGGEHRYVKTGQTSHTIILEVEQS